MNEFRSFTWSELESVNDGEYYVAQDTAAPIVIHPEIKQAWENADHRGRVRCQNIGAINDPLGTWMGIELI